MGNSERVDKSLGYGAAWRAMESGSKPESQFASGDRELVGRSHDDSCRQSAVSTANFVELVNFAMPGISSRKLAKELGHCSHAAVRHWRNGRRKPPQWIVDRMYALAIRRVQSLTSTIERAQVAAILGTRNLKEFVARRARERDANKKG